MVGRSNIKPDSRDVARISALDKQIESATAELEDLEGRTTSIEAEIKKLEQKILEIGGSRFLAQKSKVDGFRLHINLAMEEITKAEVAQSKAEKDVTKFEKAVENNTTAQEEVEAELEDLNAQLAECGELVDALQTKVAEAQGKVESSKDILDGLKSNLDEKTAAIQKFRQKEVRVLLSYEMTRDELLRSWL